MNKLQARALKHRHKIDIKRRILLKEKDFNYTSLYLYDKEMVDELEKDFKESGIRSKSQYLTHLIGLGLNAKKSTTAIADIAGIAQELQSIKSLVSDLQRQILREQTENEIYKELLCYLHYLLECIIYEEEPNYEQTELGIHDILPTRLYDKLKKLREVYGVA